MVFNKPIYIGTTVLELSKLLTYKFYYETLQPHFGDTDSFILKIKTHDLIEDLRKLKGLLILATILKRIRCMILAKRKCPATLKDELAGDGMIEFIALRSKMYAYKNKVSKLKKLEGISKHVVKTHITFDDYCDSLIGRKLWYHNMRTLRSDKHKILPKTS